MCALITAVILFYKRNICMFDFKIINFTAVLQKFCLSIINKILYRLNQSEKMIRDVIDNSQRHFRKQCVEGRGKKSLIAVTIRKMNIELFHLATSKAARSRVDEFSTIDKDAEERRRISSFGESRGSIDA